MENNNYYYLIVTHLMNDGEHSSIVEEIESDKSWTEVVFDEALDKVREVAKNVTVVSASIHKWGHDIGKLSGHPSSRLLMVKNYQSFEWQVKTSPDNNVQSV